jgi:tartrate dehydratase alpha subunit/fumarate hydratase class I-like protein
VEIPPAAPPRVEGCPPVFPGVGAGEHWQSARKLKEMVVLRIE